MADPTGFLGTGIGVISLGLQIYGELKTYLDTYRNRDDQVDKALNRLEVLHQSLDIIKNALPDFESEQRVTCDTVRLHLQSCKDKMLSLQAELQKHEPSPCTNLKGKMKEAKKKVQFPFSQNTLAELDGHLERILQTLSFAIKGLGLCSLSSISAKVIGLDSASQKHTIALTAASSSTSNQLEKVRKDIEPINRKIDNLGLQASEQSTRLIKMEATQLDTVRELNTLKTLLGDVLLHTSNGQPLTRGSMGRQIIGMGLSKPSFLKDMHDVADSLHHKSNSLAQQQLEYRKLSGSKAVIPETNLCNLAPCGCRQRQEATHLSTKLSAFILTSMSVSRYTHHPSCPRYTPEHTKRKRQFEITFIGLRKLLTTAVSAGLCLTSGAGGYSISPIFQYFAMIDKRISPAFRLMSFVLDVFWEEVSVGERTLQLQKAGSITAHALSRLKDIYASRTALPTDVNDAGETLVDWFMAELPHNPDMQHSMAEVVLDAMDTLFQLGVPSRNQVRVFRQERFYEIIEDFPGKQIMSTFLREAPECNYQWDTENLSLLSSRTLLCAIDKEMESLGLDLLCTSLLHQDEDGLRRAPVALFADMHNYHLKQTFIELAVQWPTGLNNLLDIAPGLLTTRDKEGKGLLELAITWSDMSCPEDNTPIMDCPTACNNCTCSESFEILLNHKCFLSSKDVHDALSYGSRGVRSALIRHLSQWRSKLQDVLREHLPEHCQSAMNGLALLDSEAPRAIANLKRIDVDPYELWGLEQGDYRLGPTPCTDAPQPTIFSNIKDSETAQMAFDVGFRDIDVLFEGSTPLATASRKPSSQLIGYCPWLIRHGADLNRKIPHIDKENVQQKAVAKIPDHLVLHQAAKSLALWLNMGYYKRIEDAELLSWWGPLVASSTYAGGCMCACSPKSRGCYPLTVLLNYHLLKHPKSAPWHWNDPVIDYLTDGNTSLGLVEIIIQSFTFYRLEIRHTCCASIGVRDNELLFVCSDDFEDLRAEDAERVKLLNHIVAEFMEQYRQEGLSLSSFIKGTWAKRMDMLAAEETKAKWSAAEREAVILAGVIPIDEDCDEMEKTASESDTESKDSPSVLESYFEEINFIVDGRTATQ